MEIGFVGLGRMGLNMTTRLLRGGHRVIAWDRSAEAVAEAARRGAVGADSLASLAARLTAPRAVWLMIPAGSPVDDTIAGLAPALGSGDVIVDGGNSNHRDSRRRHAALAAGDISFVDAGVSGGIWGLENGYCLMIGGDEGVIAALAPVFETLAPPEGWLRTGPAGSGHYAKMVHNGIEYGMMQAYAEGFELLASADDRYDLARVAHLWNRGSVVRSWLLELAERALAGDPALERVRGWVEDSGEGRWTVAEAVERGVPAPVITLALMTRFASRRPDAFANRLLAALRAEFGGHAVKDR